MEFALFIIKIGLMQMSSNIPSSSKPALVYNVDILYLVLFPWLHQICVWPVVDLFDLNPAHVCL